MSKVTYILGAGASYGERGPKGVNYVKRGIPVVNEMVDGIDYVIRDLSARPKTKNIEAIISHMNELKQHCAEYPTIDTYAKKLVLKKREDEFKELEQLLALFFIYLQLQNYPDTRYDTFLANILEPNLHFPQNIRVISWNYDSQFEIAYSEYDEQSELLVGSKNARFNIDYEIIKINGTATFDNQASIAALRKEIWQKIWAIKDKPNHSEQLQREETWVLYFTYLYQLYVVGKKDNTHLSFAFDSREPSEKILNSIDKIISQTDVLVIIGYTFPFFNREIDRRMLQNLKPQATVYIQDKYPNRIKQNFRSVKNTIPEGNIELKEETDQFFLPPEL